MIDSFLSIAGIISLTFLSYVHREWSEGAVVGGIVALGMRATGLLMYARTLVQQRVPLPQGGSDGEGY